MPSGPAALVVVVPRSLTAFSMALWVTANIRGLSALGGPIGVSHLWVIEELLVVLDRRLGRREVPGLYRPDEFSHDFPPVPGVGRHDEVLNHLGVRESRLF